MSIKVRFTDLAPSLNHYSSMQENTRAGLLHKYDGVSELLITDVRETININRPQDENKVGDVSTTDGTTTININNPYARNKEIKENAQLLLNKDSIIFCLLVKREDMGKLTGYDVLQSINRIVDKTMLKYDTRNNFIFTGNDILFKGRKVYGEQSRIDRTGKLYFKTAVFQCHYDEIFETLSGLKHPKYVGGFLDDKDVTKTQFMKELYDNACDYFGYVPEVYPFENGGMIYEY